ncbi:contactin-5-like [Culex pipiens pallens]|uniref:contactin-5-like n=1 Tax=Culex pipiens pallens TaxID=42434 RepID=UPI0022AA3DB5|nr:contactin-5-like [Culex pipiens pallens]
MSINKTAILEIYHPTTNDLHLEARVRGNPVPTFTWIWDGIFIHHSTEKYEIFNQHYYELGTKITTATLIINNPQMKDSGKYTLIAKNDVKSVEISKQVKIGLRSEYHKKARMDDVKIENDAPRVIPKPPTPEPEINKEEAPTTEEKSSEDLEVADALDEEQEEDDEDD